MEGVMKMKITIGLIIFICLLIPTSNGWAYDLEKFSEASGACCPMGLADLIGDKAEEWVCLRFVDSKDRWLPLDTRIYVYKYNKNTNDMEFKWKSHDIAIEGGGRSFDGKIYFGDMNGNGIQDIILIGWRIGYDPEMRGYPYEGNIYVFEWNGKTFKQLAMTKEFKTYETRLKISDVLGDGRDEIIIESNRRLYVLRKEGSDLVGDLILDRKTNDLEGVYFAIHDFDGDGKNEIMFEDVDVKDGKHVLTIVKYDGTEFKPIYKKKLPKKIDKYTEIGEVRETKNGFQVVPLQYDYYRDGIIIKSGKERYFRFIPKTKRYPGEKPEEWDNKLKEIEVKDPVFKEEPAKYPGLSLPQGTHYFADLDGDGSDELINCGPKGVSIYRIK